MRETSKRLALIHWSLASQYVSDIELAWPNEWDEVVSFFTFPFSAPIWCILWRWASPRKRKRKRSGTWAEHEEAEVVSPRIRSAPTYRYLLSREWRGQWLTMITWSSVAHHSLVHFLFLFVTDGQLNVKDYSLATRKQRGAPRKRKCLRITNSLLHGRQSVSVFFFVYTAMYMNLCAKR